MAVAQIGTPGATMVESGRDFDPTNGYTYWSKYEGNEQSIYGLEAAFAAAGNKVRVSRDGPVFMLEVRYGAPANGQQEVPQDKWNFDIDFVNVSIWSAPDVISAAATAASETNALSGDTFTADDFINYWRRAIKDKMGEPTPDSADESGFAEPLKEIYANIVRGQEAFEVERPVLTRVRTISVSYAGAVVLEAKPVFYSTAKLIALFNLPASIAGRLPANPAFTPDYTQWGWKKRKDTSEFVLALNKVQEVKDWVFAAWSTLTYEFVTV